MLGSDSQITTVSFKQITFWGGFDYVTDGWYLRRGAEIFHRLFKWSLRYRYVSHRPPTVHDASGRDLREIKRIEGLELARRGILLYHYSLLFPKKVIEKCEYYSEASWAKRTGANAWAEHNFLKLSKPFRVHNVYDYPSWLDRFRGEHPPQIEAMRRDIEEGTLQIQMRGVSDIERLLDSRTYRLRRMGMKVLDYLVRLLALIRRHARFPTRLLWRGVKALRR